MKTSRNKLAAIVGLFVAVLLAGFGGGVAQASPLLDSGQTATYEMAAEPDGTIHSHTTKEVPKGIAAAKRDEYRYGTGVLRNGKPEVGTMTVLTPTNPNDTVLVNLPHTNSLSPKAAPSNGFDEGCPVGADCDLINAALLEGATVIVADAYGDINPQYSGSMEGVRAVNALEAYELHIARAPPDRVLMYGFSGGGIGAARAAKVPYSNRVDVIVIDSGPTDLAGFLSYPAAQNGLGLVAGGGNVEGMETPTHDVIYPRVRPTFKVLQKVQRLASNLDPTGQIVVLAVTVGGALLPMTLESMLMPGSLEDPAFLAALSRVGPGVRETPYDGKIVFRYNESDAFVRPSMHRDKLVQLYRAAGYDVTTITGHEQPAPGHATMSVQSVLSMMRGDVPDGDVDTYLYGGDVPVDAKVTNLVLGAALFGISLWGEWLNTNAGPVLDEVDRHIVAADQEIDRIADDAAAVTAAAKSAPAQIAETASQVVGVANEAVAQGQQLLETITTPQAQAPTRNSEVAAQASENWLPPAQAQAASDFLSSAPVRGYIDNAPVTLPEIPSPVEAQEQVLAALANHLP